MPGKYFIADTHCDALMRMMDLGYSLSDERLQVSFPKMLNGGHDLQIFACFLDPVVGKDQYITRTLQMIDLLRSEVQKNRKNISLCTTLREVKKAKEQKKKIAMLGIEGGHAIMNDLAVLRCYRELGVIYMTLTWSNTNDWADSSSDEERWGGLTPFGHEVVREMNRIGMIVDVSHVSDKTFWHVLRTSSRPVIASHSSARSLCSHHRNMTNEMIKALAEKGGVVFVNFYSAFVHQQFQDAKEKLEKRYQKRLQAAVAKWAHKPEMYNYEEEQILRSLGEFLPVVKLKDVIRHIEHIAKIAGVEAVGIGSDFDGIPFWPEGLEDCTGLPVLCDTLRKRGFTAAEVDKIASKNLFRIFEETLQR
jgi:membrane dipeptidase